MKQVILGTLLAVGSLWLGAWGLHAGPEWAEFATLMTAVIGFTAGVALATYPLSKMDL